VIKGAPEDILRLSVSYELDQAAGPRPLDDATRASINAQFESLSKEGFRVLGIASR
jgi:Mg2+-importing ATPase